MPTYEYLCNGCGNEEERFLGMSHSDDPQSCTECGASLSKQVSAPSFVLKGPDWPSKAYRIQGQMAAKNKRLDRKQNEYKKDAKGVNLVPNVNGEQVESWSDAQKLAGEKGKDTTSYSEVVAKEKAST